MLPERHLQGRHGVTARPQHHRGQSDNADDQAADHGRAAPAPVLALGHREDHQAHRRAEHERARQVRQPSALPVAAREPECGGRERDAQGHVDQEEGSPVEHLDKCPADHRPGHGRHRRRRGPHAQCGDPPLRRTVRQHDAERRRDHPRRADGLDATRHEQHLDVGRERRGKGGRGEHGHAADEEGAPAEDVREPAQGRERRGERHGVQRDHPGQGVEAGVRVVDRQARDGEVGDGDVDEGQEGAAAREQQRQPGGRGKGHGSVLANDRSFCK